MMRYEMSMGTTRIYMNATWDVLYYMHVMECIYMVACRF